MKKKILLSIFVLCLVLAISINVTANNFLDQSGIDLNLNIGSYAELDIVNDYATNGDIINFGKLSGDPGVYYIDGKGFATDSAGLGAVYTNNESWKNLNPKQIEGPGYGGYFNVKTNSQININFDWNPDENLVSPMYFALYSDETREYVDNFGSGNIKDKNGNLITSSSSHIQNAGTNKEWHIDAAIYITEIHEQVAREYNGIIDVTISSAD